MRKKLTIAFIAVFLILGVVFAAGAFAKEKEVTPSEMANRIENAIKEVLGDDVKKQTETVVAGTLKYSDKEGNEINYHILKTTYYEADPNEVKGLNVDALGVLFNPESANSCKEMKIKDWDAALYAIYKETIANREKSAKLSEIAKITMGTSPEGESFNADGNGVVFYQGRTDFGFRFPTIRLYTTEPKRFADQGDILMFV